MKISIHNTSTKRSANGAPFDKLNRCGDMTSAEIVKTVKSKVFFR
jgi:hypothetical protein